MLSLKASKMPFKIWHVLVRIISKNVTVHDACSNLLIISESNTWRH